jgi:hypothetical protein
VGEKSRAGETQNSLLVGSAGSPAHAQFHRFIYQYCCFDVDTLPSS